MRPLGRLLDAITGTRIQDAKPDPLMDEFNIDDWTVHYSANSVPVDGDGYWDTARFVHTSGFHYKLFQYEVQRLAQQGKLWSFLEEIRRASTPPPEFRQTIEHGHHGQIDPNPWIRPSRYLQR